MPGLPVRVCYRSKAIQYPLIAAMEATDAWGKAGLDLTYLTFVSGAAQSDPLLIDGEVDFIFGSHISPYLHKANGIPMVYLGQTVNWCDDVLVTRDPVPDLRMLRGKAIIERDADHTNHPFGNHKVYLQRGGVDLTEVNFVGAIQEGMKGRLYQLVADGKADATFLSPPDDVPARELGLHVQQLPWLPMVQATTLTTMWDTTQHRPDLCRAIIRAVRIGISYFKTERAGMANVMETKVGPELNITSDRVLQGLWERNCELLDWRLYPTAEAIMNAYRIAIMQDPEVQERVNPMELWDVHFLREADEE
jgi:hypothetical protein